MSLFCNEFCIRLGLHLTYRTADLAHMSSIYILVVKINISLIRFSLLPLPTLAIQSPLHVVTKSFFELFYLYRVKARLNI